MFDKSNKQTSPSLLILLLVIALLAGCGAESAGADDPFVKQILTDYPDLQSQPYTVDTVKRVVDGDTFETQTGVKVRLIGVNTPEVHGKVQEYGKEASEYSKEQLTGKTVYLFRDAGDTDKYGRWLRYVFIKDVPVMYNETLVAEGYANTMTIQPNVMYAKQFVEWERKAREEQKGLWGTPGNRTETKSTATSVNQPEKNPSSAEAKQSEAATDPAAEKNMNAPEASAAVAKPNCEQPTIKGNINAKGEKIYHVPGGRHYEQTKAEVMFCTEQEAVDAGFRKSKQ